MKIELDTISKKMLINGVERWARLEIYKGERVQAVRLDGVEVKAKVYNDGVLMADTTVPPLTKMRAHSVGCVLDPTHTGFCFDDIAE